MVNQIYILIAFYITGVCIGIMFDIFRISRRAFKMPDIITYIEDILFWILTGVLLLFTMFTFTDGQVRLYMFLMLMLGTVTYFVLISKHFISINMVIINAVKKLLKSN